MFKIKSIIIEKIEYQNCYRLQKTLQEKVIENSSEQYILFLEHPHVITTGKRGFQDLLKYPKEYYSQNGIKLIETDRGGLATYHGNGQIVVYFILNLTFFSSGIKQFVSLIEDAIIDSLAELGIKASKNSDYRGIFCGENKICSVGMQVTHGVTTHGVALNNQTDLSYFSLITPCGIVDKGVTSIEKELSQKYEFNEIVSILIKNLSIYLKTEIS
ncbi:lipoyl(octanoyl) transferase LipB [bacterium]|nr:lipoyl(octanoyl) transferase LipB [bacterium]